MSDNIYQAPSIQVSNFSNQTPPPTLKQKLFSFDGRFSRSQYWAYAYAIPTLLSLLSLIPIFIILMTADQNTGPNIPLVVVASLILLAIMIPASWIYYAGIAKRFHDRGKSGWMTLIILIPYVGGIWVLVECGCLAGTPGPNAYGPDPLGGGQ